MSTKYSLGKEERLKNGLAIQDVLKNGSAVSEFPLKIYWSISWDHRQKFPVRVAIAVPKRRFKRAVDRNLMKRRIRESYRQNKHLIYDPLMKKDLKIVMIILFLSDEFIPFNNLYARTRELLRKLANNLPS